VLVANLGLDAEGRAGALDSRAIYRSAATAGHLYQQELRHQLTGRQGVEWGPVRKGAAEIAGFPPEVLGAFSQRRAEIEQALAERGASGRRAAEVAALDTRRARDYGLAGRDLRADWRARAAELGFGERALWALLWRSVARSPEQRDLEPALDELAGPEGLTAHRATFSRADALRGLCARAGPEWGAGALGEAADLFLASDRAVLLAPAEPYAPARYSTPDLIATERRLLAGARGVGGGGLCGDRRGPVGPGGHRAPGGLGHSVGHPGAPAGRRGRHRALAP
jgi:hypothetical protein